MLSSVLLVKAINRSPLSASAAQLKRVNIKCDLQVLINPQIKERIQIIRCNEHDTAVIIN